MSKPRVFVSRGLPRPGLDLLSERFELDVWPGSLPPERNELLQRIAGCAGVITLLTDRVDGEFFDAAGSDLKVVSNFAVGVNNIDLDEAARRGVQVGNTPGVLTDATADMAVTLLLAAARHLMTAAQAVRSGAWQTWEPMGFLGCELRGKTVGIVGMGRIGTAVAERLHHGWGMKILYTSRTAKPVIEQELSAERVPLPRLLGESDFVSLHCDLNDATRNLINRDTLANMKPTAVLVNTGRGELVDQEALANALSERRLFAAGLDVTSPEPLPPEHRLVGLENCVIAPHIGSATIHSRNAMAEIAARNLIAGIEGTPLPHAVQ